MQLGFLNNSNNLGFFPSNYTSSSGTAPSFTFAQNGNIGIGRTASSQKLDVNGIIIGSNVTTTNASDISRLKTITTNITYTSATGITNFSANNITTTGTITMNKMKTIKEQYTVLSILTTGQNILSQFPRYIYATQSFTMNGASINDAGRIIAIISDTSSSIIITVTNTYRFGFCIRNGHAYSSTYTMSGYQTLNLIVNGYFESNAGGQPGMVYPFVPF